MSVSFKFKSDQTFEVFELEDGATSITAGRLRQVVTDVKLKGSAGAFGLTLSNVQTGEGTPLPQAPACKACETPHPLTSPPAHPRPPPTEYAGDDAVVPAGASVLVKRVPLSRVSASGGGRSDAAAPSNLCVGPAAHDCRGGRGGWGMVACVLGCHVTLGASPSALLHCCEELASGIVLRSVVRSPSVSRVGSHNRLSYSIPVNDRRVPSTPCALPLCPRSHEVLLGLYAVHTHL